MRLLSRILLLALVCTLFGAAWYAHQGMAQITIGHDTYYRVSGTWLRNARETGLFGTLAWCVIFARRDPLFVRIGLVAAILALGLMLLPPKTVQSIEQLDPLKGHWH